MMKMSEKFQLGFHTYQIYRDEETTISLGENSLYFIYIAKLID